MVFIMPAHRPDKNCGPQAATFTKNEKRITKNEKHYERLKDSCMHEKSKISLDKVCINMYNH